MTNEVSPALEAAIANVQKLGEKARTGFASTYGLTQRWACAINDMVHLMGVVEFWGPNARKIPVLDAERKLCQERAVALGLTNKDKQWSDVKKAAMLDAKARGLFGLTPDTEESEATGGAPIAQPKEQVEAEALLAKVLDDLNRAQNRIGKATVVTAELRRANTRIIEAINILTGGGITG